MIKAIKIPSLAETVQSLTEMVPSRAATDPSPQIGSRRAYLEAVGIFLVVFGAAVINAVPDGWVTVFGAAPGWFPWWNHWSATVDRAAFVVGLLWLICLRPWKTVPLGVAVAGLVTIVGLHIADVALLYQASPATTSVHDVAEMALTVALAAVLAHRRGLTLPGVGLGREPGHDQRSAYVRAKEIGTLSLAGIMASDVLANLLNALPGVPDPRRVFEATGIHDALTMAISSVQAGVCEEVVLVVTLVTALEAARRPTWQIFAVGLGMRLAIHLYFGVAAPAALILAAVNIWLFRRTRRLMPLVLVHILVDLVGAVKILVGPFAYLAVLAVLAALEFAAGPRRGRRTEPASKESSS